MIEICDQLTSNSNVVEICLKFVLENYKYQVQSYIYSINHKDALLDAANMCYV